MKSHRFLLLIAAGLLALSRPAPAQVFWVDDFNADTSEIYEVLLFNPGRDVVEFGFDYSTLGIPEAPNSTGGGTTGVRFFANRPFEDTTTRASAVQIAPLDLEDLLSNQDFTLTYDVWMNVNGPLPEGGAGSTQAMMVGVGFDGITPIEAGNINGTYFTLTGEAGSSTDVRSFTNDPPDGYNQFNEDGTPINVASGDLDDAYYYGIFPGGIDVSTLPVQGGLDNQTGVTRPGQMAFQWHQVRVDVRGTEVSFYVDDLLIARDQDAGVEGTVFVGHADYFGNSVADVPEWNFSVADNLKVFAPTFVIGDYNDNGELDAADLDLQAIAITGGDDPPEYDLNGDNKVNYTDRQMWVDELKNTWIGDANLDGEFNSGDMVQVFVRGKYETGENAGWEEGDWNGDLKFGSSDMVAAFAAGGYEKGKRPAVAVNAVPEPSSGLLWAAGFLLLSWRTRRRLT